MSHKGQRHQVEGERPTKRYVSPAQDTWWSPLILCRLLQVPCLNHAHPSKFRRPVDHDGVGNSGRETSQGCDVDGAAGSLGLSPVLGRGKVTLEEGGADWSTHLVLGYSLSGEKVSSLSDQGDGGPFSDSKNGHYLGLGVRLIPGGKGELIH